MATLAVYFTKAEEALLREMARRDGATISSFLYELVHRALPELERAAWAVAKQGDGAAAAIAMLPAPPDRIVRKPPSVRDGRPGVPRKPRSSELTMAPYAEMSAQQLTAALMGDPAPGRSALDKAKKGGATEAAPCPPHAAGL